MIFVFFTFPRILPDTTAEEELKGYFFARRIKKKLGQMRSGLSLLVLGIM